MSKKNYDSKIDLSNLDDEERIPLFSDLKTRIHTTSLENAIGWDVSKATKHFEMEGDAVRIKNYPEPEQIIEEFRTLKKNLNRHKWRNLQSLKINASHWSNSNAYTVEPLVQAICQTFPKLQEFHYYTGAFTVVNSEAIECLGSLFYRIVATLQSLAFTFFLCDELDDTAFAKLAKSLSLPLNRIKKFHFDLSSCRYFTSKGVESLFKAIGTYFLDLEVLHLKFADCRGITDEALELISEQIAGKLKKLTKLRILMYSCYNPSNKAIEVLQEKFSHVQDVWILNEY